MNDRLLTTREVADRLGLAPETVLRWARRGRLSAVYLSSRAVRFREDDLDGWLEQRTSFIVDDTPVGGRAARERPRPDRNLTGGPDEQH